MYMRHWLQSPSSLTHGNIIKREIFSKRTENSTDTEGAILRYVDSFSRCYLEPRIASVPTALDDRQLIFYIVDGSGIFEAGDLKQQVEGRGRDPCAPRTYPHLGESRGHTIGISDVGRGAARWCRGTPEGFPHKKLPRTSVRTGALDASRTSDFQSG